MLLSKTGANLFDVANGVAVSILIFLDASL